MSGALWSLVWPAPPPSLEGASSTVGLLVGATAVFMLYAYPLSRESWAARLRRTDAELDGPGSPRAVTLERVSSGIAFGFGAVALWLSTMGGMPTWLGLPRPATSAAWVGLMLLVALPAVRSSSRKPSMWSRYPEFRVRTWTPALKRQSLYGNSAYLLGYEAFFRGLLTFGLASALGDWVGLATVSALYAVAHIRKDANEAMACLPMGFVFGFAALQSGSIWAPWFVHVVIGWVSEVVTGTTNPDTDY